MSEVKRTFKKVGNKIIIKQSVPDTDLSAKGVLDSLQQIENNISKILNNKSEGEKNIKNIQDGLVRDTKALDEESEKVKQLNKFGAWAKDLQERVIAVHVLDNKETVFNKVTAGYANDEKLSPEENDVQKYHQYVHLMASDPLLSEKVNVKLAGEVIRAKGYLDNPWK